jgi:hypothetical protein
VQEEKEVEGKPPVASWAMDRLTGVIRDTSEVKANMEDIPLEKLPNAKCKKCHGRGYRGRVSKSDVRASSNEVGTVFPCECTHLKKIKASW